MTSVVPLIERKQKAARERILRAAAELFAEHGFDSVSVSDIAERAEVGRTTFFRHFGDKQEVVFAREQAILDALTLGNLDSAPTSSRSAAGALRAVQPLFLQVCAHISEDPDEYRRHEQLVEGNIVLQGRGAAKAQLIARRLGALLVENGWDEAVASFASQIALACYETARATAQPENLVQATRQAFERALSLGAEGAKGADAAT
ncbi:TetR/AcrR family transcriptional regulator [Herbiconiux daphne]|uniref:TetR/AcrR family transcriptional regulator n=1 Tax=Herbiconiux daphne TaxID=2970914 RepID=A0ABT2H032_9MICO|nr:TetR/AcrR family transcriptional regulator [Herbiconiux daphne]MCS5732895.1 TetR/AcrR family transcriptional regulator [Herbiconiux daphne]